MPCAAGAGYRRRASTPGHCLRRTVALRCAATPRPPPAPAVPRGRRAPRRLPTTASPPPRWCARVCRAQPGSGPSASSPGAVRSGRPTARAPAPAAWWGHHGQCVPGVLRSLPDTHWWHQQGVEQALVRAPRHHATADLAQDRVVEALVRQFQTQKVLPVKAAAHRLRCLAVGQILRNLQHHDERQAPRGLRGRRQGVGQGERQGKGALGWADFQRRGADDERGSGGAVPDRASGPGYAG
jgi:hypothetical protein